MSEWRDIKGRVDGYEVSDEGEVRRKGKNHILKPITRRNHHYLKVNLWKKKKYSQVNVHELVAEAFVDNPNNCKHIVHKDGDFSNNRASNLEWNDAGCKVTCKWCGKVFIRPHEKNTIFCSEKCRKESKADYDKKRMSAFKKPKAPKVPKSEYKPSRPKMIDNLEYCRNYADNQKAETLRLLREGLL